MIVHLDSGNQKAAHQHQSTHMVLSDHAPSKASPEAELRELVDEDRSSSALSSPSSTSSPSSSQPRRAATQISTLSSVNNTNKRQKMEVDRPVDPAYNASELQPNLKQSAPNTSLMFKVSAEEDTEFKRFADDDDNEVEYFPEGQAFTKTPKTSSSPVATLSASEQQTDRSFGQIEASTEVQSCNLPPQIEMQLPNNNNKSPPTSIESHSNANVANLNESKSPEEPIVELRFLVRRREAGALIGKRGSNIKRLRETFRSSMFSIPDTGNGPERVVCIATNEESLDAILIDLTQLLMEKSPENDDQIELKLLIHSSHAGSIIGIGGQSIKKLRNESKAAIKIYEMCCPLSNERVCAIKAKPQVAANTIKLIQSILNENPIKGTVKPYDALHFDLGLIDKYGGYLPDEPVDMMMNNHYLYDLPLAPAYNRSFHDNGPPGNYHLAKRHYSIWRSQDYREPQSCEMHEALMGPTKATEGGAVNRQHRAPTTVGNQSAGTTRFTPYGKLPAVDSATIKSAADDLCHDDDQQTASQAPKTGPHPPVVYTPPAGNLASRFHPYTPPQAQLSGHPSNFMAACNRLQQMQRHPSSAMIGVPIANCGGFARLMHPHYGPQMEQQQQFQRIARCTRGGVQNEDVPSLPGRCRHGARACLCMFMPMNMPDLLPAGPFVQMNAFNSGGGGGNRGNFAAAANGFKSFHYYSRSPSQGVNKKK